MIGRDHLDCGSVASPYRETEAMADGSDAIADWPLLNALVNTASGASWVSIHHGGGVGHRPVASTPARSPSPTAPSWRRRSSSGCSPTTRPWGCIRHVDAGYDDAVRVAAERGVRVPMPKGAAR